MEKSPKFIGVQAWILRDKTNDDYILNYVEKKIITLCLKIISCKNLIVYTTKFLQKYYNFVIAATLIDILYNTAYKQQWK